MSLRLRGKDGITCTIDVRGQAEGRTVDDGTIRREVEILEHDGARLVFMLDGVVHRAYARAGVREVRVVLGGRESVFQRPAPADAVDTGRAADAHEPVLRAPVPGRILKVGVATGASVRAGDVLAVIEAMKMETPIIAPADGTVVEVHVETGSLIDQDQAIVTCTYEDARTPVTKA
jgi:biotin carboxyl carrier protein